MKELLNQVTVGFRLLLLFSILTGLIYPTFITGIAQIVFPWKANGSLIKKNNQYIGSQLIGQSFTEVKYFWGRYSATSPFPYNAANSSGSNLGPSNPNFLATINDRVSKIRQNTSQNKLIPVDLVTSSGSGLDPEISPLSAFYQVSRIAKARNISEQAIQFLIRDSIKNRVLGILGEPRVNILKLNLALDYLSEKSR
jgi:K+-transporting ATPase ATPase C chain